MAPYQQLVQRIRNATIALLGDQFLSHQIDEWCDEYEKQSASILSSRGIGLPSIAIVGAKGQGKSWLARQLVSDDKVANCLPSGVLSSEATTSLHWIGPSAPDSLDKSIEQYHPCVSGAMLDLGNPYMLLDTPGLTDDNPKAASIAKDALSLSPIKLLAVRRDQLRSAIQSQLANLTEGAICIPIVTCVPMAELASGESKSHPREPLQSDLNSFCSSLSLSAPKTRFLPPILVPDFEATGSERSSGAAFCSDLQGRLKGEAIHDLAATRSNRLAAATNRLHHRIGQALDSQIPQLSAAVRRLRSEADQLPTQAIEAVLGSEVVLHSAIRSRLRGQLISDTSLIWFPYRTVLSVLGLTNGAWDRLILSLSGSVPSIFGTFAAWARNLQQSNKINWEMQEGIRERLNRQVQDRLEPIQAQFHRAIARMKGSHSRQTASHSDYAPSSVRLTGIEELQSRARNTFEAGVEKGRSSWLILQWLGLVGSAIFWLLLSGPIVSIYREYLGASYVTLTGGNSRVESFPHPSPALIFTSVLLSLIPLMIFAMLVMTWQQRRSKVRSLANQIYGEERKLVEELQQSGVVALHYDDPLLENAEFLIQYEQQ